MTIDIVYVGLFLNYFVKRRSGKFFNSAQYKKRNNVFVDIAKHNTYHIKKNSIHIFVCLEDSSSMVEVCKYLKFVFRNSLIGIRTDEILCEQFKDIGTLNWLRM